MIPRWKPNEFPLDGAMELFRSGKLSVVADRMLIIERTYNNYRVSAVLHRPPRGDYSLFSDAAGIIPPASSQNNRRFALLCDPAIGCSLDFIFGFISLAWNIGISIFLTSNHRFQNVLYIYKMYPLEIFFFLFLKNREHWWIKLQSFWKIVIYFCDYSLALIRI